MAEQAEQVKENVSSGSGMGSTALKAAAAAAAAGAAAVVARKALSHDGSGSDAGDSSRGSNGSSGNGNSKSSGMGSGALGSIASGGWEAARDALLPAAEDVAGAAGAFVAENAPEVVRDRIVPRFIESFNDSRGS
jgi:hypothetical protein